MLVGLLLGMTTGGGAYLMVRGMASPPPRLAVALARLDRPLPRPSMDRPATPDRWGAPIVTALQAAGFNPTRADGDLWLVGRSRERHAFDKVLLALALPAIVLVAAAALATVSGDVSMGPAVVAAAGAAIAGFVLPDSMLRTEARRRRAEFSHGLGAYLDLVAIVIAGGGGLETALDDAAGVSDHWAFQELKAALAETRLTGRTPWQAFDVLGADLAVGELRELAAAITLCGEHGARIRASLAARAESLRTHRLAAVESDAQAATERMSIPIVLMLFGFVAFVMFPAVQFVLDGL